MSMFKKAVKSQAKLRLGIYGPSGSGKTYTSLQIASALGSPVAVIDTENATASKYSDVYGFDCLNLIDCSPKNFIAAIKDAEKDYPTIVIDSLSHAWVGENGALQQVEKETLRSGNSFSSWKNVTPQVDALRDAIIRCKADIICTFRSKNSTVLETNDKGKKVPRIVGLEPVYKDKIEYEFDVFARLDESGNFIVQKTRAPKLIDGVFNRDGVAVAKLLREWLNTGAPIEKDLNIDSLCAMLASAVSLDDLRTAWLAIKAEQDAGMLSEFAWNHLTVAKDEKKEELAKS